MAKRLTEFAGQVKKSRRWDYQIVAPLSTTRIWPVVMAASSDARIDSHIGHVNRQTETKQMRGSKLLDVL